MTDARAFIETLRTTRHVLARDLGDAVMINQAMNLERDVKRDYVDAIDGLMAELARMKRILTEFGLTL